MKLSDTLLGSVWSDRAMPFRVRRDGVVASMDRNDGQVLEQSVENAIEGW